MSVEKWRWSSGHNQFSVVRNLHPPCIHFTKQSFSLVFGGRSVHIPAQTQIVLFFLSSSKSVVPTLFSLACPFTAISTNCTLHISSATDHKVTFISHLLTCTLSYTVTYVPFSAIIQFFSRTLKSSGSYPWGYAYPRLWIPVTDKYRHSNVNYATTTAPKPLIIQYQQIIRGPGSSVGIATDYGLDGPEIESRWGEIFSPSRPALGPTQPPVQWVLGLSRG